MSGPFLPRPTDPADPMAPVAPRATASPNAGNPMAPVGSIGGAMPPTPPSPTQSEHQNQPWGAEISDQLAAARIAARKLAMRRRRAPRLLIASMLLLLIVVAGLGIGYATGVIRFGRDRSVANRDNGDSDDAPVTNNDYPGPKRDTPIAKEPAVGPIDLKQDGDRPADSVRTDDKSSDSPEQPTDPAQVERFAAELLKARQALGKREFRQAIDRIDAAEKIAVSDKQQQLVAGFRALTTYVEGFWDAVREGPKGLEKAGELKIGNSFVSVVEVGPGHLLIREAGENRRYLVDQLPAKLAVAIAQNWFDDRPDNKLYVGAFYFVGPPIDVSEAKRLWQEAAAAGVDVNGLLALLEM